MGGCNITILAILCFCCSFIAMGQNVVDSLRGKTYNELFTLINQSKKFEEFNLLSDALIKKAKNESNTEFLIGGYNVKAYIYNDYTMIKYCDSIIDLTSNYIIGASPMDAYLMKGNYYFNLKNYPLALDNYLMVSNYAIQNNNNEYIIKSKYSIAGLKRRINEKDEALKLFKECLSLTLINDSVFDEYSYLKSIISISNIYIDLEAADSSSFYNKIGLKESKKFGEERLYRHFSLNEAVCSYFQNNYKAAIDSLHKETLYFENVANTNNLPYAYYYTAKSYQKNNEEKDAINYYKKVDSLFKKNEAVYNISRKSYEELIKHYRKEKDLKNQLYYINQLIKVDSLLHEEELYLSKGIYKKYDIPQLEAEKKSILQQMDKNDSVFKKILIVGIVLLLISFIIIFYQHYKKISYKKKFDAIMNSIDESSPTEVAPIEEIQESIEGPSIDKTKEKKSLDISQEIVSEILEGLQKFEKEKQFLSHNITLSILAKELKTNNNYLSKVINHYKKLSFSNYLNLLRVNYFIDLAKRDPNIRKFTIKAIANEVGFSNSESFSKAFYKHKGIKPSYFLKELENSQKN
jgi:AraC-like DNA-binding protein